MTTIWQKHGNSPRFPQLVRACVLGSINYCSCGDPDCACGSIGSDVVVLMVVLKWVANQQLIEQRSTHWFAN